MISIVRFGTPRAKTEGPRIGTVRRPPRGVKKADIARHDYYDVWQPLLSPSAVLVKQALAATDEKSWLKFVKGYRREMTQPEASRLLDLLAALSHSADFSVGCYCENEARCHRSVLRQLLTERGAALR
ncbi:MAG: DUF488 family protein [Myxococcaceae bacterium]